MVSSDNNVAEKVSVKELDRHVNQMISSNQSIDKRLLKMYQVHKKVLNGEKIFEQQNSINSNNLLDDHSVHFNASIVSRDVFY